MSPVGPQPGDSNVRILTARHMLAVARARLSTTHPSPDVQLRAIVEPLSAALSSPVAALTRRAGRWVVAAGVGATEFPADRLADALDRLPERTGDVRTVSGGGLFDDWTVLRLSAVPPAFIAIQGDWTLSAAAMALVARTSTLALRASGASARARRHLRERRFTSSLARVRGIAAVAHLVAREMARAVDASVGVVAIPARDRRLKIVGTFGYDVASLEHVRIEAGVGVLGTVFDGGRTLHVGPNTATAAERRRRPRYRTNSYVALPFPCGADIVAVAAFTDREGDRPFTRREVATLRALAPAAALALARESVSTTDAAPHHVATGGAIARRDFEARLAQELHQARRHDAPLTVLMLHLDDRRILASGLGPEIGNMVIGEVAGTLRGSLRAFDVCSRIGDTAFAIALPGSDTDSALVVADRIRNRILQVRPTAASPGDDLWISASVGIAVATPDIASDQLMARADAALESAKRGGRDRVVSFGSAEAEASPPREERVAWN